MQNLILQIQVIQNKKMRMLDSYYSGDINKDEMTALKDKYDKEIEKIKLFCRNNRTTKPLYRKDRTIQMSCVI